MTKPNRTGLDAHRNFSLHTPLEKTSCSMLAFLLYFCFEKMGLAIMNFIRKIRFKFENMQ